MFEQFVSFTILFIYCVHEDRIIAPIPKKLKYGVGDIIFHRFKAPGIYLKKIDSACN